MPGNFAIDGREVGQGRPPYVIAELSANHNGSLEHALATIDEAQRRGAHAVKIQTYTADTMTIDCDLPDFLITSGPWAGFKLYDLYKWAETPYEWHAPLFEHARKRGVTLFSTPFDESAVELLEDLGAPAYKIASFELLDLPLIQYVARTGKPMIMSTGMASEAEIAEAVAAATAGGCEQLALLHCVSSYPAPIEQANLRRIGQIARRFDVVAGLSDHTLGTTAAVAAVALGACLIEKHFILSRQQKGPDSEFSIEPEELGRLCTETAAAWQATRGDGFESQPAEEESRKFRRSLYFVRNMRAGEVVTPAAIRRIRPGFGLPPRHYSSIVGRRVARDVSRGTAVSWEQLEK